MPETAPAEITRLLHLCNEGDAAALDRLAPIVYKELRRIASRCMRGENANNSLQPTALVHEAYLRLVNVDIAQFNDRAHFFAVAARMMRRILVSAARRRHAGKRGPAAARVELNESLDGVPLRDAQIVRLNDALDALAQFDSRKAQVIELRFFGGLSVDETAEVLKISAPSVLRDWKLARAWLVREME